MTDHIFQLLGTLEMGRGTEEDFKDMREIIQFRLDNDLMDYYTYTMIRDYLDELENET